MKEHTHLQTTADLDDAGVDYSGKSEATSVLWEDLREVSTVIFTLVAIALVLGLIGWEIWHSF